MSTMHFAESLVIEETPETLYTIIADYHQHHPHILPEEFFDGLEVVAGGVGAGTRVLVQARAFGTTRTTEALVSEPEPGRRLVETDVKTGSVTAFAIQPLDDEHTEVTISIDWIVSPGLRGLSERLLLPYYLRNLLKAELVKLAGYAAGAVQ